MSGTSNHVDVAPLIWHADDIEGSVGDRFRRVVERFPDRLAVRCPLGSLSYSQLYSGACGTAREILDTETGRATVLLLLDHDQRMINAMLGAILAGRGYVALDPRWPTARLVQVAKEVGETVIVTHSPETERARALVPEVSARLIQDRVLPGAPPASSLAVGPDDLFAVFYSSGTTGRPKGSAQSHRKILQRGLIEAEASHIVPQDRIALTYGCAFGASVVDIFNAMLSGASLHLFDVRSQGLQRLAAWVVEQGITYLHLPAALFRELAHCLEAGMQFSCVREVVVSGRLYRSDLERLQPYFADDCVLVSRLSSSEAGMITRAAFRFDALPETDVVPVGDPIPGKEVWLLDAFGKAVKHGEMGEVVVRSRFLSDGYFARPELNARRFQDEDPDGTRTLHTGDLARRRTDGMLEWMGRKDDTVKVRGHRVELSAVEDALHSIDGVRDAAVLPDTEIPGDVELTAYCVLDDGASATGIVANLRANLPEFMVPTRTVLVETLPLTLNGKVDRGALRALKSPEAEIDQVTVAPMNETEAQLLSIWSELLGQAVRSPEDDFFLKGGHSLLAQKAVARIRRDFGVDLPLSMLFAHPTPRALATIVESLLAGAQ